MRLQLNDHLTNHLRKLPESGMGFQLVDIRLKNGKELHSISAFNCEEIELPSRYPSISSNDIEKIQLSRTEPYIALDRHGEHGANYATLNNPMLYFDKDETKS